MEFFLPNDVDSLSYQLVVMLNNQEKLRAMAHQNYSAALQMSMPQIIREYIHSFDMQQRVQMLKNFSRLRRSRNHSPTRRWMMRQVQKNMSWDHNSNQSKGI